MLREDPKKPSPTSKDASQSLPTPPSERWSSPDSSSFSHPSSVEDSSVTKLPTVSSLVALSPVSRSLSPPPTPVVLGITPRSTSKVVTLRSRDPTVKKLSSRREPPLTPPLSLEIPSEIPSRTPQAPPSTSSSSSQLLSPLFSVPSLPKRVVSL